MSKEDARRGGPVVQREGAPSVAPRKVWRAALRHLPAGSSTAAQGRPQNCRNRHGHRVVSRGLTRFQPCIRRTYVEYRCGNCSSGSLVVRHYDPFGLIPSSQPLVCDSNPAPIKAPGVCRCADPGRPSAECARLAAPNLQFNRMFE